MNQNGWHTVALSTTSGFESVEYTVPSSRDGRRFRWRIQHVSGTADYCLIDSL